MEIITQSVRNSGSANAPILQANGAQLILVVNAPAESPTIFDLSSGKISIKRGTSSAVNLNSDQVVISNLSFKNFGNAGTSGSISFQFDANYFNPAGKTELNYGKTFFGSASLR